MTGGNWQLTIDNYILPFPMDAQERHNRNVMLQRFKIFWLKGVLEESLHGAELIDLNMALRPNAVANSTEPGWQQGDEYDTPLPIGTKVWDVFDDAGGALLIMGSPGAGKTTTLLQLATDLVQRADLDENYPVPVALSLATWRGDKSLADWMIDELSAQYEAPRQLGKKWVGNGRLLPLLDGLDEVEADLRHGCAQAINQFRRQHPNEQLVVTTRVRDYQTLDIQLKLAQAIVLQPLSLEQIDIYLASVGKRLAGLRAALQSDASLRELAQSPLMLSIMTLAYYRMPADVAISLGGGELSRKLLFDVYVERMTRYRGGEKEYNPDDAVRWLAWLARQMAARNKTMLFLESIQPNWLPRGQQRQFADRLKLWIGLALALAGLLGGLIGWIVSDWSALAWGIGLGALAGLLAGVGSHLLIRYRIHWYKIETTEKLDWSWPRAGFGSGMGAFVGMAVGLPFSLMNSGGVGTLPWPLLGGLFVGMSQLLENGLIASEVKLRTAPGQGIERSRRNGLLVGVGSGLGTAVILTSILALSRIWLDFALSDALGWIIGASLFLSLAGWLMYGGLAALQHQRLLAFLQQADAMPPNYVHFLDYASERNLLRKVGGGYMFAHALLLDY
ncbi:MAG: NACHT domain-containing protein, partial [Chloroflexi bacterium]|nr:NACHT domain-containing protein [Chloroflexota bacterium]